MKNNEYTAFLAEIKEKIRTLFSCKGTKVAVELIFGPAKFNVAPSVRVIDD